MKITVIFLSLLLLASNAFWLYQVIDTGVTLSYKNQQIHELEETRKQLMATFPEVAKNVTKAEIVAAASKYTDEEAFEKEGCTWIGWLGFKFDENNTLKFLSPSWSTGENDPCHSAF